MNESRQACGWLACCDRTAWPSVGRPCVLIKAERGSWAGGGEVSRFRPAPDRSEEISVARG